MFLLILYIFQQCFSEQASLLSLIMAAVLMCVYTPSSSRPGRPPKRSYGASVQESPRILHHRANNLLSPALLSPTGKPTHIHLVECAVNLDEPQFPHFNTYEKYMLKSVPPLLSFCSSFILCRSVRSSFMHLLFPGDSDEWHTPAGSLIHLFIPLYFPLPLTGQKPRSPRPLISTPTHREGWTDAEIGSVFQ